ncbi:MAG: GNAT family N-acetyltransferase [Syntrophaceae bacterium]|nr:GNAT family N-acetyltransferase [Syntrophaceae bacterium]
MTHMNNYGNKHLSFKVVSNPDEFAAIRNTWANALKKSSERAITQTWEWLHTWWTCYGHERNLRLIVGYDKNEIIGIAPFSLQKRYTKRFRLLPYKTMCFIGGGFTRDRNVVSDYLNIIIATGYEPDFVDGVVNLLNGMRDWDELLLENISVESCIPDLLLRSANQYNINYRVLNRSPSILIKLPARWEDYLGNISSGLRYRIMRGIKEFHKLNGCHEKILAEGDLQTAFDELGRLHQYRWESRGEPGAFSSSTWKKFHKSFIPLAFKSGWLDLSFLRLNGQRVAGNYNFQFDKRVHFFQSGMIPHENKHIRLGLILHSFCIEDAIRRGMKEYDFLRVGMRGSGYKEMWGNYSRELLDIRLARPGIKENLYLGLSKIARILKPDTNLSHANEKNTL